MYEVLTNPIEQEGQRVLTTAQLAEYYETDSRIISNNFNRNRDRFIEGKHFYRLTGEALKEFKTNHQIDESSIRINVLYLWTERGALLHAKSLNTDKAWEVHDFLIDTYFRVQEQNQSYNDLLQKYNDLVNRVEKLESKQTKTRKALPEEEPTDEIKLVLTFIDECCMKRVNGYNKDGITTRVLYDYFVKWCYQEKNVVPPKKTDFVKGICNFFDVSYKNKNKIRRKTSEQRYYIITLRPEYINK